MHRKEVTHSNGSYERKSCGQKLADEMGRAKKIPWYTHRLMHRKRLTCELHDSYFHLMTIKHSISKIEWASKDYLAQLNSTSQLETSVGRESHIRLKGPFGPWWAGVAASWRRDVVGKATSGRRGLWALMSWGPEKMLIRCRKESHHPAEWPLDLQLSIKRTRKTQRWRS